MKSLNRMMRKTLRKLGKTFTEKYNFKRLLQTAPDILSRYKRHEDAINSIEPHKHIQMFDLEPIRACDPNSAISVHDTIDIETFGPGAGMWPTRIKFAEQVLDLYSIGYHIWAVEICGGTASVVDSKAPNVEVTRYKKPTIAHHNPIIMPNKHNCTPIFNQKKLSKIDENLEDIAYFLVSDEDNTNTLTHLKQCSLIPDGFNIFGAAFYDRDVAYLYADSLRRQMERWPAFRKQRI